MDWYDWLITCCLGLLLVPLMAWLGDRSQPFGYVSFGRIARSGSLGFNVLLRILAPAASVALLATLLALLGVDGTSESLWVATPFYWAFLLGLLCFLGRLSWSSPIQLLLQAGLSTLVTYFVVQQLATGGIRNLYPSGDAIVEFWVLVAAFVYALFNQWNSDRSFDFAESWAVPRYYELHDKYAGLLLHPFDSEETLQDLFFSVMVVEDFQRPASVRLVERLLAKVRLAKTTGIMQVTSTEALSDEESVRLAQPILLSIVEKTAGLPTTAEDAPDPSGWRIKLQTLMRRIFHSFDELSGGAELENEGDEYSYFDTLVENADDIYAKYHGERMDHFHSVFLSVHEAADRRREKVGGTSASVSLGPTGDR